MSVNATADPRLAAYLEVAIKIAATQNLAEDRRANTRTLSIIFAVLAVVFVGLRFLARHRQGAKYGWDDWLIVLALPFLAGNLICTLVMIHYGLGLHSGALSINQAMMLGKILLIFEPLYVTDINIIKISLLFMYYRIFPVRSVKIGAYVLAAISTSWNMALIALSEGQCIPRKKSWAPWVAGSCIDLKATFLALSIPSILTDIAILCLPLPQVWKLQTNRVQKISLSIIFLLGSFVVFTSIYRFTVYVNYDPNDLPYTLAPGCAWNVIELSSGIISACLPTLGPLVRSVFHSINDTWISKASHSGSNDPSKSKSKNNRSPNSTLVTIGGGKYPNANISGSKNFHKLTGVESEDLKYGIGKDDLELRPADGASVTTVTSGGFSKNDGMGMKGRSEEKWNDGGSGRSGRSGSGDEIPLTIIRHQRDVEWSEERVEPGTTVPAGRGSGRF